MSGYVCKHCGTVLPNRGLLMSHYRDHHRGHKATPEDPPASPDAAAPERPAVTRGPDERPFVPWSLLPPEMQVLRQGQQVALRGWAFVDHKAGGLIVTEIEPI